jgi:peptidoglycan hydrolase-like amidase
MPANLTRRDFSAALLVAAALPRLALAQTTPKALRFGVFSLFQPQQLLLESAQPLLLHLDATLLLVSPEAPATRIQISPDHRLTIVANNSPHTVSHLRVTDPSGQAATFTLAVPPPSLHGTIHRRYTATLDLQLDPTNHSLQPLVTLDLEAAVSSIVLAESPAHAPLTYLEVQAIVSRSFLLGANTGHRNFDFCDTTHCQFLREVPPPDSAAATATRNTRGRHLTYEGQPLPAMYSRSCGGRTHTLAELGLPIAHYPYYSVPCEPCLHHPERWRSTISPDAPAPTTERSRIALNRIRGWSALPSNSFTRTPATLEGTGIGHGIGLCQRGAAALAAQGLSYRDILSRFYPNTAIGQPVAMFGWRAARAAND